MIFYTTYIFYYDSYAMSSYGPYVIPIICLPYHMLWLWLMTCDMTKICDWVTWCLPMLYPYSSKSRIKKLKEKEKENRNDLDILPSQCQKLAKP